MLNAAYFKVKAQVDGRTHPPTGQDLIYQSLEQVNNAVKRATAVVGIFLGDVAVDRLDGAVLIEAHDECRWRAAPVGRGPQSQKRRGRTR